MGVTIITAEIVLKNKMVSTFMILHIMRNDTPIKHTGIIVIDITVHLFLFFYQRTIIVKWP